MGQNHCIRFILKVLRGKMAIAANLVAYPANRLNQRMACTSIQLPSKVVDVDVHDVGYGIEIQFPDLLNDRRACHGLPGVAHEELQQRKLLRSPRTRSSTIEDAVT